MRFGTDIENLLVAIAEHTRAKAEKLELVRYFFGGCLDGEQRTRLYEVLVRLAENSARSAICAMELCTQATSGLENAEWKAKLRALDEESQVKL